MSNDKDEWDRSITDQAPSAPKDVKVLYDNLASTYDRAVASWGYDAPAVAATYLAQSIGKSTTGSSSLNVPVLDAGCGTGLTGAALTAQGFTHLVGIDLSTDSLRHAENAGHYQSLQEVDLTLPLPFGHRTFGGIICAGVFSYIVDVQPVLREFIRLLRPGGVLVFTQREDHFKQRRSAERFARLHADGGFNRLEETEPMPYLPGNPSFAEDIGVHYFVWQKWNHTNA